MGVRQNLGLVPWIVGIIVGATLAWVFVERPAALSQTDQAADGRPVVADETEDGSPVVLELFTSQGCSSCPPADALISELGSAKGVIPLAYHVDYWNNLGWSDPFSSHQFSERQSAYSRAMDLGGEYTPQMVIGGESQFVGSDRGSIARAIAGARSKPASGRLSLNTKVVNGPPRILRLKVDAQVFKATGVGPFTVMVAVYENGLVSKIGGGENDGREIAYDYTVRKLLPAFELQAAQVEKELTIELEPSWSLDHLGVATFIQDPRSLRIEGAANQYPIASN
jgi:hypothetical protein